MRITRHWKQVFDPKADLIYVRPMKLDGHTAEAGDDVSPIDCPPHRARIWWKAGYVALKHWDYDKGVPCDKSEKIIDEEVPYADLGGGWYLFPDGGKAHGKKNLKKALKEWHQNALSL